MMTPLSEWQNFYVIVGSSAGAVIGLEFVVITLIADRPMTQAHTQASAAFSTPSVVLFGIVLFVGLHNARDAVTYHIFVRRWQDRETERAIGPKEE